MTSADHPCRAAVLTFAFVFSKSASGAGTANLQTLDVTANPAILTAAAAAGAIGVRATPNAGWHGVEPVLGGGYRFGVTDATQLAVQNAGLDDFRILQSSRPEYNPAPRRYANRGYLLPHFAPDTGLDLWNAYKSFVRAVVRRYYRTAAEGNPDAMPGLTRGVRYWSYTPEIATFWVPITDPAEGASDYATMFALTASAVHEVDPAATVFLPFNGLTYLAAFVDGFLPRTTIDYKGHRGLTKERVLAEYGGAILFVRSVLRSVDPDAYDLHLYGDAESIPGQKAWLLASLASIGKPARPVWSMEGGEPYGGLGESFPAGPSICSGGSAAEDASRLAFQSAAMVKHFSLAFASGYESVTFNLSPEYADSGSWFGDLDLLDACSKERPAYYTYRLCREELLPYETAAEEIGAPAGARLVRFTFAPPRGDVWVAWDPTLGVDEATPHDLSAILRFENATVTHPVTLAGETTPGVTTEPTRALLFGGTPVFLELYNAGSDPSR